MNTTEKIYFDANDIAQLLGTSQGFAYKLIRKLNKELSDNGYITVAGKVSAKYFKEKYYGCDMQKALYQEGRLIK